MQLRSLSLWQFRNYQQLQYQIPQKNLLLIGDNGQGKSNFLEAVYLAANFRSYRTNNLRHCIANQQKNLVINAEFTPDTRIALQVEQNGKKKLRINDQNQKTISQAMGRVNTVIISPEDLQLMDGAPAERRKFIDTVLSFLEKGYYQDLIQYQQVLKQRNELLRKGQPDLLEVWDERLVLYAIKLYQARKTFIQQLSRKAAELYQKLEFAGEVKIHYKTDLDRDFAQELKQKHKYDLMVKTTSLGCHHDDFQINLDGQKAMQYASQGQKRALVIALKMAEFDLKKQQKQDQPIILLDDTLLEFDQRRGEIMVREIIQGCQIIATATKKDFFQKNIDHGLTVVTVEQGALLF